MKLMKLKSFITACVASAAALNYAAPSTIKDSAIQEISVLTNPKEIATLNIERPAESCFLKCLYWLAIANKEKGGYPDMVLSEAMRLNKQYSTAVGLFTEATMFEAFNLADEWGLFTEKGLEDLKQGIEPTISKGQYLGEKTVVKTFLPQPLCEELKFSLFNLTMVPISQSKTNEGKVSKTDFKYALELKREGLLSDNALKNIQDAWEGIYKQFEYSITDGEVTIEGYEGNAEQVVFPETVVGLPVKYIESASQDGSAYGSIFHSGSNVKEIKVPKAVTKLGHSCFDGCEMLQSVSLSDGLIEIGGGAFGRCKSLTEITIPNSVTKIGSGAFQGCANLKSISIPDSVKNLDGYLFNGCSNLSSVKLPLNITKADISAMFENCTKITHITLPKDIETIGFYAFSECISLTSVLIPDSVTRIYKRSFAGCKNLSTINIPSKLTYIHESAFEGCDKLPAELLNKIRAIQVKSRQL